MLYTGRWLIGLLFCIISLKQVDAQFIYVNPPSGSLYRNPETTILLKSKEKISWTSLNNGDLINIIGSKSGAHSFTFKLTIDGKNIVITPDKKFAAEEKVSISIKPGMGTENGLLLPALAFSFFTKQQYTDSERKQIENLRALEHYAPDPDTGFNSKEGFDDTPPSFTLFVDELNAFEGATFFASKYNLTPEKDKLICILNNDTTFSLSRNVVEDGADFKVNKNGYLTYYSPPDNKFYMLDSNYYLLDSFQCKNGYETELDNHEFLIFPNGNKYLLISHKEIVDMSQIVSGGNPEAIVEFPVIQEQDEDGNVIFEWASWDYFNITDATYDVPLTASTIDPFHTNSIEVDQDGNLLISSRYLDEITKIDHQTGEIIWRMGGENSEFSFVNDPFDPHFSHQHDVRRLPNGNITLFDNGNLRFPQVSYAKEYLLDEVNKVATLVWSYKHPAINNKEVFGLAAGNVQRLANGNTLINYGLLSNFNAGLPSATEVTATGDISWEIRFTENQTFSYRMFKFNWEPCSRPTDYTLSATSVSATKEKLSWGAGSGSQLYKVQYRITGTGPWQAVKTVATTKTIKNLEPATTYEWRVKSTCVDDQSSFTAIHTFITAPFKNMPELLSIKEVSLFPNPASGSITIQFESDEERTVQYALVNLMGAVVDQKGINALQGCDKYEVNIKKLVEGIYFITLYLEERTITEKLVVE